MSSLQNIQALSALLSAQQEDDDEEDYCKVRKYLYIAVGGKR